MCSCAPAEPPVGAASLPDALRRFTLDRPKLRCVVGDGDSPDMRLLLLSERLGMEGALRAEPAGVPVLKLSKTPCSEPQRATSMFAFLVRIISISLA